MAKVSIIIPTCDKTETLLKPCLESLAKTTDLSDVEIIIVANGADELCREVVKPYQLVWFDERIGYPQAVNEGLKKATGEYIILLNNDLVFQGVWIPLLIDALEYASLVGPHMYHAGWYVDGKPFGYRAIAFWCVAMKKTLMDEFGVLDESYSPGYGEDSDYCIRIQLAGHKIMEVKVPILHEGNNTFKALREELYKKNDAILRERYLDALVKIGGM